MNNKEEIKNNRKKTNDLIDKIAVYLILFLLIIGLILGIFLNIRSNNTTGGYSILDFMFGTYTMIICGIGLFIALVIIIIKTIKHH